MSLIDEAARASTIQAPGIAEVSPQVQETHTTCPDGDIGGRPQQWSELALRRLLAVVAVLGIFGAAFATWTATVQLPVTGVISGLGFGIGLLLITVALSTRRARTMGVVEVAILVLAVMVLIGWTLSTIYFQPGYGTDEAAFEQYAAQLMVHGHNPYGVDLLPALNQFRVPIQYATYTTNGGIVGQLGYPSLPVLLVGALLPVTHGVQTVIILNAMTLLVSALVMARLLPARWRSLAPLTVVGLPLLFGYAVSGVNAVLMMAALMGAAHRWNTTGAAARLRGGDIARAACLGLAVSIQQLAWFVAPFLLVGIYLSRRGDLPARAARRVLARYVAIAASVFLLLNLPFIVWGPREWLAGVTAPLAQHAIPYGQGLVDLTLFLHVGGGALTAYTLGAAAAYVALLALYALRFRALGRACFVLPSAALFLPTRSLAEYFMTLVAVWVIATITAEPQHFARAAQLTITRRWPIMTASTQPRAGTTTARRWAGVAGTAGLFAPAAVLLGVALATPAPLSLHIDAVRSTGQLQSIWKIQVHVTNHSHATLRPHFAVNFSGQAATFYNVLSGPSTLAGHSSAAYVITAPNRGSMPALTTPFVLQAVTDQPETISSSSLYTPQPYSAFITPGYVNQVLHAGQSVTLAVKLRSPFGADVEKAGVTIALGQLIYAQGGLVPGEAEINEGRPGQTPVTAVTDRTGTAIFHVHDNTPQDRPIYFQAYVLSGDGFPFGYSDIVPVFWAS